MAEVEERFYKAQLFRIRWVPTSLGPRMPRVFYQRIANAALLAFGPFLIEWRMPWLKHAVHQMGWDSCWRQMGGKGRSA